MDVSGSNYQILNSASSVIYTSTSSSTAFNYLLGPSGIAPAGSTINVEAGAYTVDSTWNININSITVTFQTGTTLTATNAHNAGNDGIAINANNDIITGLTFNGNGLNQYPTPTTTLSSNTYDQMYNGISTHGANNALIENSTIYNWRCFGICIYDGNNNGVVGCTIYDIGANCLSDGIPCTNTYFVNNILYGCSDVGISFQGTNGIATGNTLNQMNAATAPPMHGFQQSYWGIGFESASGGTGNGNYALVAGNTITNTGYAITLEGAGPQNYVIVSGNTIATSAMAIVLATNPSNYNIVEFNTITTSSVPIYIASGCTQNTIYGNTYDGSAIGKGSGYISDSGTSTTYTAPTIVTITVTSTPTGTDYVTANGNAGYAGTNSNTPYTFYTTIGTTITLTANNPPGQTFTKWSDGGAQTHTITTPNTDTTYTATY
jgi:parallel beta-helix repeat protein